MVAQILGSKKTIGKKVKVSLGDMKMNLWENTRWEGLLVREAIVKLALAGTDKAWGTIVECWNSETRWHRDTNQIFLFDPTDINGSGFQRPLDLSVLFGPFVLRSALLLIFLEVTISTLLITNTLFFVIFFPKVPCVSETNTLPFYQMVILYIGVSLGERTAGNHYAFKPS